MRRASARRAVGAPAGADRVAVAGLEVAPADPPAHCCIPICIGLRSGPAGAAPACCPARQRSTLPARRARRRARGRTPRRRAAIFSTRIADGDDGHPEHAHDPEREQREHQPGAAADAVATVPEPGPQCGESPAPSSEQEVERRAAVAQAGRLERRQLVDARRDQRSPGDPRASFVPGNEGRGCLAGDAADHVRGDAERGPGEQVARDEQRGLRSARPRRENMSVVGSRRRQHHRDRHRQPDADEPGERPQVGPGAGVHARASARPRPPRRRAQRRAMRRGAPCS